MNSLSSLPRTLLLIADLATLSIACGLAFAALVQPRRNRASILFSLFCLSVAMWGLFSLSTLVPELQFGLPTPVIGSMQATSTGLAAFFYLLFVMKYAEIVGTRARALISIAPILLVGGAVLVWAGLAFEPATPNSPATLTPLGYGLLALIVAYAGLAFWVVAQSKDERLIPLRIPSLVLMLAFASAAIHPLNRASVDTLLATVVAIWAGGVLLRQQLFKPLEALEAELRTANRDLRQSVHELANERAATTKLRDELHGASGFKSEFFTGMSHKMRTPLSSIVGYSELLQTGAYGELNATQTDRLEKIHRNGQSLLDLINTMLDLGKIEAGRLELHSTVFKVKNIVDTVLGGVRSDCESKQVTLESQVDENLPSLFGDEKRIQQVISELLDNAVKFTSSGSIRVTVRAVHVQDGVSSDFNLPLKGWLRDGEWALITISDTGKGISPEEQAKIFDEFYQTAEERAAEASGTGLGLTICKRLVELHSGVIWVKSMPGEGTTFFVALPTYHGARETVTSARVTTAPLRASAGRT